jgi:hypothetical protein
MMEVKKTRKPRLKKGVEEDVTNVEAVGPRRLRNTDNGRVYIWTEQLAKHDNMIEI